MPQNVLWSWTRQVRWAAMTHITQRVLYGSLALCVMLSGCRRSPVLYPTVDGPLSAGEGLRIGVVSSSLPLDGRRSINASINATYLLRDRVNQCGGVNQAPISFVMEQADQLPRSELTAVKELIDEHQVHGAIAHLSSFDPSQSLKEFVESQIPALLFAYPSSVNDGSSLEKLSQSSPGSLGQLSSSYQDSIEALAQVVWSQGYTQVAFVSVDDSFNQWWTETFTQAFEALGGQRVDAETPVFMSRYSRSNGQEDSSALGELNGDRPYRLFSFEPEQLALISTWLDQDQTALIAVLNRFRSLDFLEALAPLTVDQDSVSLFWADWLQFETAWDRMASDLNDAGASGDRPMLVGVAGLTPAVIGDGFPIFKQAWANNFSEEPPSEAAYAWDAASLFALAAEAAGNNGGSSMAAQLRPIATPPGIVVTDVCDGLEHLRAGEDINYEGASGSLNLNAQGTVESRFDLWRITPEGEPKIIDRVTPEPGTAATP
ncbi:MAG: ABC transporter substrate-binding protein [Elainellaceae cyanobacterium]